MPPRTTLPLPFKTLAPTISHRSRAMAAAASGFPTPMTPPFPAISKEVELRRAMTAAARSGAYELGAGDVVFEDESMVVVNKLSGIYCETLLKALSDMAPPPPGNGTSEDNVLHLANRLDRDTSGLMVITKSNKVAAKLVKAFTDHKVKKSYIALCIGHAPKWKKLTISSGHGRSKFGAWRVYSKSDVGRTLPGGSMVKDMMTCFEVLSINGQKNNSGDDLNITVESKADESGFGEDEILIRAWPRSGRTHQIRLHCQYLGIPIRGDVKYGGVIEWKGVEFDLHALHAESLSFDHPVSGSSLCFRSPLPLWAKEMITMD